MRKPFIHAGMLRWAVVSGLFVGPCSMAAAQQQPVRTESAIAMQDARRTTVSDLAKDNNDRVAASAGQIQAILARDSGLLVELKRYVAKEATANGQVVDDAELTDQAIYGRLFRDQTFRGVATRLLQRYGYLLPALNPDSELARERDLLLQERAKRLLQVDARRNFGAPPQLERQDAEETLATQRANCESHSDASCMDTQRSGGRSGLASPDARPEDEQAYPPAQASPPRGNSSAVLRAGAGPEELDGEGATPSYGSSRSKGEGSPGTNQEGLQLATLSASDPHKDFTGSMSANSAGVPGSGLSSGLRASGGGAAEPLAARTSAPIGARRGPVERDTPPVSIVHTANPYADVPSLFDMYVQASAKNKTPERFGMKIFQSETLQSNLIPMDLPVGPDYVVGPGDGLAIDIWGGVSQRMFRVVDREGRLSLPEVGPLLVSGRSLGEVQRTVQQLMRTQYRDVSADVSLSRLRTVRVYVVGEVAEPGAYDISSLSTPLNALYAAGGITPRGSLRSLKHFRGKQLVEQVDAYSLLLHGVQGDLARLENGDTLLVPPVGAQVTIDGMVRRPAIYELRTETTLAEALDLAGGILPAAALKHVEVQRLEAHEKRTMLSLDLTEGTDAASITAQLAKFKIQDGDQVQLFPIAPYNESAIYLQGHVLRPGRYSFRQGMKLSDLISSYSDLLPEPAHYAEIVRLKAPDYRPAVESFDLTAALRNPANSPQLDAHDTIRIFSRFDFETPPWVWVGGEVRAPGTYATAGQIRIADALHLAGGASPDAWLDSAQLFRTQADGAMKIFNVNLREALAGNPIDNLLVEPRDRLLIHKIPARVSPATVDIRGEVAKPGRYPLAANMRVADLLQAAGGLLRSANTEHGDLTHYAATSAGLAAGQTQLPVNLAAALNGDAEANTALRDGDVLTVPQLASWKDIGASVMIHGEVAKPGIYGIQPGERLSSVLRRAGGLLPTAYPQAAVFERIEVRDMQQKSRQELIQRLEQESTLVKTAATTTGGEEAALQQAALLQRQRMLDALRNAPVSGRLVVHIPLGRKNFAAPADDIELRAGDALEVPKQPGFVLVIGQVYNSNAITSTPRKNANWYLERAGGSTPLANRKAIFIVRANGSVTSGGGSLWSGGVLSAPVGPGDTIVVPEKPLLGGAGWKNFIAVAQLAQTAAITAAIAVR